MAYFDCIVGSNGSGGVALTVTCDSNFAGLTITCTDGTTTLTETCPSSSPYTVEFEIPNAGTWTVSGVVRGVTFSTTVDIPSSVELHSIPDGSTVTPVNDIQTWLHCAGIYDKTYTILDEVLADNTTLLALISSNNAVDYMVRSTSWASSVCANQTVMGYIGNNDYCADTLLADATWCEAICNSAYFESVLNVKVPTMTSNTTPSGEAKGSPNNNGAYCVFDNNPGGTIWQAGDNSGNNSWIQYYFPNSVKVSLCSIFMSNSSSSGAYRNYIGNLLGSTDGSNFETIATNLTVPHNTLMKFPINSTRKYNYFRLNTVQCNLNSSNPRVVMGEAQFYGRA